MKKNHIFIIGIILLMAFKWTVYYNFVQCPGGFALPVLLTILFSMWIFIALTTALKQKGSWLFFFLYTMFSLIFLVDVIYFKQFNARASVRLLTQVGAVGDVKASILQLVTLQHFIGLIDLPVIAGFIVYLKKTEESFKLPYKYLTVLPILIAIVLVIAPFRSAYSENVSKREFFSFHVQDIVKSVMVNEELDIQNVDIVSEINNRNQKYTDLKTLEKGKYWGIGKGKNLIVIQLESFQDFVVNRTYNGEELTPNLNALIKDSSMYFPNYFEQVGMGNTSDAEFATQNGMFPTVYGQSYSLYQNNTFKGLPWQMRDNGYTSLVFHGYKPDFWGRDKAYPNQGWERFYSEKDYTVTEPIGFGLNDFEFFEQNIEVLKKQDKPTYSFMISLSNHHPYLMPATHQVIQPLPEHKGTLFGNYVNSVRYTDAAIGHLIDGLKQNGLYDNTVIAIYGDHHGLVSSDEESDKIMTEVLGKPYRLDEMLNVPLLIHVPHSGISDVNEIIGSQIDFMPTIMNIMGIQNKNYMIFGKDLNNTEENLAGFQIYAPFASFINDKYILEMSNDYVFDNAKAYDRKTGEPVDINLCFSTYKMIIEEWKKSKYILDNNLLVTADQYVGEGMKSQSKKEIIDAEGYIPLGGGKVNGLVNTLTLEALQASYDKNIKVMHLNFTETTDAQKEWVVTESWTTAKDNFKKSLSDSSYSEFVNGELKNGLTQMDLRRVIDFLSTHDDVNILADAGEAHLEFANYIYKFYPDAKNRFIYKVDKFEDFNRLSYLKENFILLDLRETAFNFVDLIHFAKDNSLYGVLLNKDQLKEEELQKLKQLTNIYFLSTEGIVKQ